MRRLKPGEYQKMTPEKQFEHRKKRRAAWEKIPENKEKVRLCAQAYQKRHWQLVKSSYFERQCKICGKTVMLTGRRVICDDCKNIPSPTSLKNAEIRKRTEERKLRNKRIIHLGKTNDMTQEEIAKEVGVCQPVVSYILRANNLRRKPYGHRNG